MAAERAGSAEEFPDRLESLLAARIGIVDTPVTSLEDRWPAGERARLLAALS